VVLGLIPTLIVSLGCFIYWGRAKNWAGAILLLGNLYMIMSHFFRLHYEEDGLHASLCYVEERSFVFFIFELVFAVGFLMMAFATPRKIIPPAVDVEKQSVPAEQKDRNDNDVQK